MGWQPLKKLILQKNKDCNEDHKEQSELMNFWNHLNLFNLGHKPQIWFIVLIIVLIPVFPNLLKFVEQLTKIFVKLFLF